MSMVKDLEAAVAKAAELEAKLAEVEKGALSAAETVAARHKETVEQMAGELATAQVLIDASVKDLAAALEKNVQLTADLAASVAEREALQKNLAIAEKALAQPAFADAAMAGRKEGVKEGAEVTVAAEGTPTWDAFNKLTDPAARTKFWNENETKLRQEMARVSRKG